MTTWIPIRQALPPIEDPALRLSARVLVRHVTPRGHVELLLAQYRAPYDEDDRPAWVMVGPDAWVLTGVTHWQPGPSLEA